MGASGQYTRQRIPRSGARWFRGWGRLAGSMGSMGCRSVALLCAVVVVGGCFQDDEGPVERLSPRTTLFLTGVPVPAGFELEDKNTEDYESGVQRWARHWYRGSANPRAVRDFYRDQMPLLGWIRVSDQNVKGTMMVRFEKESESCTVAIESAGWFKRTRIQIVMMPFSRTAKEPSPRRPMP